MHLSMKMIIILEDTLLKYYHSRIVFEKNTKKIKKCLQFMELSFIFIFAVTLIAMKREVAA